jgi:predicted nucleic acid-binding protein
MAKKQVVCDTDVMIDYWNVSSKRHIQTKEIFETSIGLDNIVISAITKMELLMGASNKSEEVKINKKLYRFTTALISSEITLVAFELFERYRLSHGLTIPDCFIAATSKVMETELFTYNVKDYRFIDKLNLFAEKEKGKPS